MYHRYQPYPGQPSRPQPQPPPDHRRSAQGSGPLKGQGRPARPCRPSRPVPPPPPPPPPPAGGGLMGLLRGLLPRGVFNPDTGKVFGMLDAEELLLAALILLLLEDREEDDVMLIVGLLYLLFPGLPGA